MGETVQLELESQSDRLRALRRLRHMIDTGRLSRFDPLPSERKLSATLGVGRTTLRGVLQQLSDEGLLQSRGRRGRIVANFEKRDAGWMRQAIAYLDPMFDLRDCGPRDQYWANYVSLGVAQAIRSKGLHVVSLNARGMTPADASRLAQDSPAGVIVPEVFTDGRETLELVQLLASQGVRLVVYGGHVELDAYDRVTSDHEDGAYQLTRHLITQRGCRRIAHLWAKPTTGYWFARRQAGYERAMREAGLMPMSPIESIPLPLLEGVIDPADSRAVFEASTRNVAGHLIETMMAREPVEALMVSTDRDAFAAAAACRIFGKVPGKDVLIAGYDNYWERCVERNFEPNPIVATVDKQNTRLGEELVKLLLDRQEGNLPDGPQCRSLSPKLIVCDET